MKWLFSSTQTAYIARRSTGQDSTFVLLIYRFFYIFYKIWQNLCINIHHSLVYFLKVLTRVDTCTDGGMHRPWLWPVSFSDEFNLFISIQRLTYTTAHLCKNSPPNDQQGGLLYLLLHQLFWRWLAHSSQLPHCTAIAKSESSRFMTVSLNWR